MSEWLRAIGPGVGNHLWQSTAFAAVAWMVTLLLRRNQARVRYGVWVAASVKFLVPFSLLIGLGGMLPRPQKPVVAMPVYSAVDEVGMPFSDVETAPMATVDPTHAAMRPRHEWGTRLPAVAAIVWVCGVGVVLAVWCGGWLRVTRTLRRARRVEDGREAEVLRRVEAAIGGRRRPVTLLLSRELMEPGMFGIWRPVLIWPERLSERLDDEHIEAIMAHELMHARRRDNLTAVLHMVGEAAFWFHPVVWWMERRMVEERERACDEAVVEMGSRPGVYAESLLKACRFCVESPLVCVAGITGADLAARVKAIMTLRSETLGWSRKLMLAGFGVVAIGAPMLLGQAGAAQRMMLAAVKVAPMPFRAAAYAMMAIEETPSTGEIPEIVEPQSTTADAATSPAFEVASIRPTSKTNDGSMGFDLAPSGRLRIMRETVKGMIYFAYLPKMGSGLVEGGPDWTGSEEFDINAKVEESEVATWGKLSDEQRDDRIRPMVRRLLAERFHLNMHTETQVKPVFGLVQAKGGAKLKEVAPPPPNLDPQAMEEWRRSAHPTALPGAFMMSGDTWSGNAMPMGQLVSEIALNAHVDHLVVDETGLKGYYSFTFTPSRDKDAPILLDQIEDQLGLKLEARKLQVKTYVIDSVVQPSVDGAEVASPVLPQAAPAAPSQPEFQVPKLEVISVRQNKSNDGQSTMGVTADGLIVTNTPLLFIIHAAFEGHFSNGTIVGLPGREMDRYDIVGKVSDADLDKMRNLSQPQNIQMTRAMLQMVLASRFQMKFHDDDKDGPVYELVVAKNGSRLSEATPDEITAGKIRVDQRGTIKGPLSPKELADALTGPITGRVVVDKTGMTGKYDVTLTWTPDRASGPNSAPPTDASGPSIFTAVQEQLGLKLQPARGPVKSLVIDHIERPSEN